MHELCAPLTESVILHSNASTCLESRTPGNTCRNRCTICVHLLRNQRPYIFWEFRYLWGLHCYVATGATLGLSLPTSKSLDFNSMGLLGLPWGCLCQRANDWISLLWGYWGYLRATFANEQIIRFHCFGATGATLGLPLPTRSMFWRKWISNLILYKRSKNPTMQA